MMWLTLKAKLAVAGAAVLSVLTIFFRLKYLKEKNENLEKTKEVLEARVRKEVKLRKKESEVSNEFRSRRTDVLEELRKDAENFEGVDNLVKPNDW